MSVEVHHQLIRKALLALDEAIDQARIKPVAPTFALRFALAWLFTQSNGWREPYDAFWRVIRDPFSWASSDVQRAYLRPTKARTEFYRICRSIGIEPTGAFLSELSEERRRMPRASSRIRQAIRDSQAEREAENDAKRRARDCNWNCADPGPERKTTR
jgi:hypothetical protein